MPILSSFSNSGITTYNPLRQLYIPYNNNGYTGKDPLFHATTALVTAKRWNDIDPGLLRIDAILVGAGGGGSSGSPSGGISTGGGGGAGGYMYANNYMLGTFGGDDGHPSNAFAGISVEVGLNRAAESGKSGKRGSDTFFGSMMAFGGAGGVGGDNQESRRNPGQTGFFVSYTGNGSGGGNNPTFYPASNFTPWQGNNGGDLGYYGGTSYNSGGGGGMGGAGSKPPSSSPGTAGGQGGSGLSVGFPTYSLGTIGGGGGGACDQQAPIGLNGGSGGGGYGGIGGPSVQPNELNGANASNYGAGGGGANRPGWGGRGGNGVVLIRYPTYYPNSVFVSTTSQGGDSDELVMQYSEVSGYRHFLLRPKTGVVQTTPTNYSYAKGRMFFPHTSQAIRDISGGLYDSQSGRSINHRINFREAERTGTYENIPLSSTFTPFNVNGWAISLNEDYDDSLGWSSYYCWLDYENNLTDFANIGTGDFSYQTYVKMTRRFQGGVIHPIFYMTYANGNYIQIGYTYDGSSQLRIFFNSTGTSGSYIMGDTASSIAQYFTWYKVRVERSLGIVSLYINDVRVKTVSDTTNYSGTPNKLWVGFNGYSYAQDTRVFCGQIEGTLFKVGATPVFNISNSNNFRNILNPKDVKCSNQNKELQSGDIAPEIVPGSLTYYSSTQYPGSDKGTSVYFDGSSSVNTSITWEGYFPGGVSNNRSHYTFAANTGDFTIDGWIYPTVNANGQVIYTLGNDNYFSVYVDVSLRRLAFDTTASAGAGPVLYTPAGSVKANCWTHFVVQRESGNVKVFASGNTGGVYGTHTINEPVSGTNAGNFNFNDVTRSPTVGARHDGNGRFYGYISQLRFFRYAVYSGNVSSYTVPTTVASPSGASFYLAGATNSTNSPPIWDGMQKNNHFVFVGNINTVTSSGSFTNNRTGERIANTGSVMYSSVGKFPNQYNGNYSLYSDGNGHYFYFKGPKNHKNFKFDTDFCVEGFWNADYVPSQKTIIDFRESTSDVTFALKIDTSNRILLIVQNTTYITSAPITLGQIYHIAVERVNGVITLYIDGVRSGNTLADSRTYVAKQNRPVLFTDGTSLTNESFVGNMHILRVTKDLARYSANFSPGPTAIFDTIGINQSYLPYI